MKDAKFSWVDTHHKLTDYLKTKENHQKELINLLKSVGIGPFNDKENSEGQNIELDEIDPFTFYCYIYKYGAKKRLEFLKAIAAKLQIEAPLGESGIPSAQAQKVWLFPYKYKRTNNEINRLWRLFKKALIDQITDEDFANALQIRSIGKTKLTEALFYVNPEKYLPINGPTKPYIKEVLGIDPKFNSYSEYLDLLSDIKENIDVTFYELSYEAWKWNETKNNISTTEKEFQTTRPLSGNDNIKQYWLYAPGRSARLWEEFYNEGIMGLGWDKIGDLRQYKSRKEIKEALVKADGGIGSRMNDVSANDDFLNKVNIGDVIIVKKGRHELLGYGVVSSNYTHVNTRSEYQSIRHIDWKLKGKWKVDLNLPLKTLTDITTYTSSHPDHELHYNRLLATMDPSLKNDIKEVSSFPLNTILYGPPGTGKTYHTVLRAAEIIENRKINSYDEALSIFKAKLHSQIEFITFHQNYSYEDFIQGLRPDVESKGSLSFSKKDGSFTTIATDALFEYYKRFKKLKVSQKEKSEKKDENEVYLDFIEYLKNKDSKDFKSSTGSVISIASFTKNDNVEFKHANSSRTYLVSGNRLLKLFEVYPNIADIKNVHSDIRNAIGGCNTTVYWVALKEFITFYNNFEKSSDEQEEELFEEISYDSKKKLLSTFDLNFLREVAAKDVPNYVIIIDEINRANISRVFGELITLIEPDKRSHGKIPMEAKLPSGDTFIVPSNLYIIGTMNTADKSIALLDIALRRRFEFEPMYPKYSEDGLNIKDESILKSINQSIINEKGHDFQIGHSYFMDSQEDPYDFERRMNVRVIPLLLEYFMNDASEVKRIISKALSDTPYEIDGDSWPLRIIKKND